MYFAMEQFYKHLYPEVSFGYLEGVFLPPTPLSCFKFLNEFMLMKLLTTVISIDDICFSRRLFLHFPCLHDVSFKRYLNNPKSGYV